MKAIHTDAAPKAIGPYSQAVVAGGFVFCSGQIALDPVGKLAAGGVREQTAQVLKNLKAVLAAADATFADVVSTIVYLRDMNDFAAMNVVYAEAFSAEVKPARATVSVSSLPKDALVEISCVAVKK